MLEATHGQEAKCKKDKGQMETKAKKNKPKRTPNQYVPAIAT